MEAPTQSTSVSSSERGNTSLPTKNELHGLLSSAPRRRVLDILAKEPAPIDLFGLAGSIVERADDERPVNEATEAVVIDLHHNHLPKLENAGLIQYDSESKCIDAIHEAVSERRFEVPTLSG